jgi:hypothetical protein
MLSYKAAPEISRFLEKLQDSLDERYRDLIFPLFQGLLFGEGRRTVTSWIRAGHLQPEFRRVYRLLGAMGRAKHRLDRDFLRTFFVQPWKTETGPLKVAIDDTPTKRGGPCVEGASLHRNPTSGPAHQNYLYGHIWVTLAYLHKERESGTCAWPILANLYVRESVISTLDPIRNLRFRTKLQLATELVESLTKALPNRDRRLWLAVDGAYAMRGFLHECKARKVVVFSRLRKNASLYDLPAKKSGRGRPRIYGKNKLSLEAMARTKTGWEEMTLEYSKSKIKVEVKSFLATWRPAGGAIRVVLVRDHGKCRAYFCTDVSISVRDIVEMVVDRNAIEGAFHDLKEVLGASESQVRYLYANVGCWQVALWMLTLLRWWGSQKCREEIVDRSLSPWDNPDRRASLSDCRRHLRTVLTKDYFTPLGRLRGKAREIASWLVSQVIAAS